MNEPFEEFQFKPLTQGLGFHKKATQEGSSQILNSEDSEFSFSSKNFKTRGLDLIEDEKSLDFRAPFLRARRNLVSQKMKFFLPARRRWTKF